MAYFLFIDESGQDHKASPYEVLAGVAVEDRDLWNLVTEINQLEDITFGVRYNSISKKREIKARKFIDTRVYKQASKMPFFEAFERSNLAKICLEQPEIATFKEIAALAQAKLFYTEELLKICLRFRCKVFGSIIKNNYKDLPTNSLLRKDYVYLFERFYYFLEDKNEQNGIVVFDELDKTQSHILIGQMEAYFKKTEKGKLRANLIIPEPFFVHSDLTTGIKIADIVAYVISWSLRFGDLVKPERKELLNYTDLIKRMRYRTMRDLEENENQEIWSIVAVEIK